ncbi:hypothetical protein CEW89_08725 [Celeribacter ethanolicus]|uniref:Uncharacterized protein n=1 Tax=Celeribacter ethanolicus TaxID=1758178 RepID=A0A291GC79_9RHOB|nr:hypothetical protein CEW89_08725 [Celeribacter ethanolicus]
MITVIEISAFRFSDGLFSVTGVLVFLAMRPLSKPLPKRPPLGWRRKRFAAATGGFGPDGTGGAAVSWVQGRSALPDMLLANIIVGQYCVCHVPVGL